MRIHQIYMQLPVQLTSQSFDTGYATTLLPLFQEWSTTPVLIRRFQEYPKCLAEPRGLQNVYIRRPAYPVRAPQCWGTFHCWWRNSGYNCWLLNLRCCMFQLVLPRYLQYGGLTNCVNRRQAHCEQLHHSTHPLPLQCCAKVQASTG